MSTKNEKLKHLFIHIPKSGGTSMCDHDWNRGSGHRNLASYYREDPTILTDYYKWCFVRNPWDRVVSAHVRCTGRIQPIDPKWNDFGTWLRAWYKYKSVIKNRDTLDWGSLPYIAKTEMPEFRGSMKVHFFPQSPLLKVDGKIEMDFIGRFEFIDRDWDRICDKLGVKGNLRKMNTRKNPIPYQEYYNDETKEIVRDLYEEDIVEFGYEFNSTY